MRPGIEFWEDQKSQAVERAYREILRERRGKIRQVDLGKIYLITEINGVNIWDVLAYAAEHEHSISAVRLAEAVWSKEKVNGATTEELKTIEKMIAKFKKQLN